MSMDQVLVGEALHPPLPSLLAPMSAPVTGTAPSPTVEPTTSPAAPAASSAPPPRKTPLLPPLDLMPTWPESEVSVSPLQAPAALAGKMVTGYAPGLDATSITSLIEWNATDAMRQGTLVVPGPHIHRRLSAYGLLRKKIIDEKAIPSDSCFFLVPTLYVTFFFFIFRIFIFPS